MARIAKKAKAIKKGTSQNMQKSSSMNDKLSAAEGAASGARYQLKVNKKGKSNSKPGASDYTPSKTAAQRTKDLNKANDRSKTLGRAKNIVSKQALTVKNRKEILAGGKAGKVLSVNKYSRDK